MTDGSAAVIGGAELVITHIDTGAAREARSGADGFFRVPVLAAGRYRVAARAPRFATTVQEPIDVTVSQTARVNIRLVLSAVEDSVTVVGGAQVVDTTTNALGRVVSGRELVDLPLNGRNFTQLGLLQTGVAPLTAGVTTAGGSLRQGQAYAVNGMRPEQNVYLVDGTQNLNRMDGGYALKIPVDAVAEFRILTQSAPPEYGGTGGATTSVVTRSGGNQLHGSAYEFLRNDVFDARNFFSRDVEPLNQHQFGATLGGPLRVDRLFGFGYYEGFRNKQGVTTTATVPTAAEREGDFSGMSGPLLNLAAGGVPIPGNRLPPEAINPVARNVVALYPLGNVSPSIYRETVVGRNELEQVGGRLDLHLSPSDQIFGRYSYSGGHNINPISVRGTDVPGYPTRDDLSTHSAMVASTHIFSPALVNSLRVTWFRHRFLFDQRLNRTPPSALGFGFELGERCGTGPAVLQRQRLHPDWRRDHRPAQLLADDVRGAGGRQLDAGQPSRQGRRRAPPHRTGHVPGDRAELVLRFRVDISHEQRRRQPAAGSAGHLLPGPGRLQPRPGAMERRRLRPGRMARNQPPDLQLRPALRAHRALHRGR